MLAATLFGLALSGCATEAAFSPHFRDNSAGDLHAVLERIGQRPAPTIINAAGHPMIFAVVVAAPTRKQIIAMDLLTGQVVWSKDADVTSRLTLGPHAIYAREGREALVARDITTGQVLWQATIDGKLVGVAADENHVYYVSHGAEGRHSGQLVSLDARSGSIHWRREAEGSLGAPAARAGLVILPFMSQWVAILDGDSGTELARIRSTEEQVTFVRSGSDGLFYGGEGIFALTDRAVAGSRSGSSYGQAKFPGEFIRPVYAFDGYSPAQADYSAVDRNRVLWRGHVGADGRMEFASGESILHTYRFFFGIDARQGTLRWTYVHPRVDVVAAEHDGPAVFLCAQDGALEAFDAERGRKLWQGRLPGNVRVLGATFDVDGYRPPPQATDTEQSLAKTLTEIIWDNDHRFGAVKLFAVEALAKLPDRDVGGELVRIVTHEGLGPQIYTKAGDALVARKDRSAIPLLVAELKKRYDYAQGVKPRAVDVLARALAAVGDKEVWPALIEKLRDPATPNVALREVALALKHLGAKRAVPALREFLLEYRADPAFAVDPAPLVAVAEALATLGSQKERDLLKYVAEEPRTLDKLATYVRHELEQTQSRKSQAGNPSAAVPAKAPAEEGSPAESP